MANASLDITLDNVTLTGHQTGDSLSWAQLICKLPLYTNYGYVVAHPSVDQSNIYISGYVETLNSYSSTIKVSPTGSIEWQRGIIDHYPFCSASSASGVYVMGWFSPYSGNTIIKYNDQGVEQWHIMANLSDGSIPTIETDSTGNLYVPRDNGVAQIGKYNSNGSTAWLKRIDVASAGWVPGSCSASIMDIAIDNSDNLIYCAQTFNTVSSSNTAILLAKIDNNGTFVWSQKVLDPLYNQQVPRVVVDNNNNIYVLILDWSNTNGVRIIKYNTDGVLEYSKFITVEYETQAISNFNCALDPNGNLYVILPSTNTFSTRALAIIKLDSNANIIWQNALHINPPSDSHYIDPGSITLSVDNSHITLNAKLSSVGGLIFKLPSDGTGHRTFTFDFSTVFNPSQPYYIDFIYENWSQYDQYRTVTGPENISLGDINPLPYVIVDTGPVTTIPVSSSSFSTNLDSQIQYINYTNSPNVNVEVSCGVSVVLDDVIYAPKSQLHIYDHWLTLDTKVNVDITTGASAFDNQGNVIYLGSSFNGTWQGDLVTKISSNGSVLNGGWRLYDQNYYPGTNFAIDPHLVHTTVGVDSSNNIYAVSHQYQNYQDNSLTKIKPDGVIEWSIPIAAEIEPLIAVDNNGNIYVTIFTDSGQQGTYQSVGFAKYNTSGVLVWQNRYEIPVVMSPYLATYAKTTHITTDNDGNLLWSVQLIYSYQTNSRGYVIKINSNGSLAWAREVYPSEVSQFTMTMALYSGVDSSNNVYTVSPYVTPPSPYSYDIPVSGDLLLCKYNSSGVLQYAKKTTINAGISTQDVGIIDWYTGYHATVDPNGNVYVVFRTKQKPNFVGNDYTLIVKFDSTGNIVWQRIIVETDSAGNTVSGGPQRFSLIDANETSFVIRSRFIRDGWVTDPVGATFIAKLPADGSATGQYNLSRTINNTVFPCNVLYTDYTTQSGSLPFQAPTTYIPTSYPLTINVTNVSYPLYPHTGTTPSLAPVVQETTMTGLGVSRDISLSDTYVKNQVGNIITVTGDQVVLDDVTYTPKSQIAHFEGDPLHWIAALSSDNYMDLYSDINIDTAGNVYVSGEYDEASRWGSHATKFNTYGEVQWSQSITSQWSGSQTLDSDGNLYTLSRGIITKYNPDGLVLWQVQNSWITSNWFGQMKVDSTGHLYTFNSGNESIRKYDTDGTILWEKIISITGYVITFIGDYQIIIDSNDDLIWFSYIEYEDSANQSLSYQHWHLTKLSSSGSILWTNSIDDNVNGGASQLATEVDIDANNNIYIVSTPENTLYVDNIAVNAKNLVFYKYSTDGVLQYVKRTQYNVNARYVYWRNFYSTVDSLGNTYIAFLHEYPAYSATDYTENILVVKYDTNANIVWQNILYSRDLNVKLNDYWLTDIDVNNDSFVIQAVTDGAVPTGSVGIVAKLPADGTGYNDFTFINYNLPISYQDYTVYNPDNIFTNATPYTANYLAPLALVFTDDIPSDGINAVGSSPISIPSETQSLGTETYQDLPDVYITGNPGVGASVDIIFDDTTLDSNIILGALSIATLNVVLEDASDTVNVQVINHGRLTSLLQSVSFSSKAQSSISAYASINIGDAVLDSYINNRFITPTFVPPDKRVGVAKRYTDIDLSFLPHPATGDVYRKFDENAIKQAVRSLILTNHYERLFHPEIGSQITGLLFEPYSYFTDAMLKQAIVNTITNHEPRVDLINVTINSNPDNNAVYVSITFKVKNTETPLNINITLQRTR